MGHNQILTAEDLLKKMREGTKDVHEISLRTFKIPVRVLSISEMNQIRKDAIKQVLGFKGDDTDVSIETQKSVLMLASTIDKGVPLLTEKLLGMMTTDEVNHLYNEYIKVSENVNPSLERISPEAFKSLVDALKKNTISSADLSLPQLRAICSAFVDMINRGNHS